MGPCSARLSTSFAYKESFQISARSAAQPGAAMCDMAAATASRPQVASDFRSWSPLGRRDAPPVPPATPYPSSIETEESGVGALAGPPHLKRKSTGQPAEAGPPELKRRSVETGAEVSSSPKAQLSLDSLEDGPVLLVLRCVPRPPVPE